MKKISVLIIIIIIISSLCGYFVYDKLSFLKDEDKDKEKNNDFDEDNNEDERYDISFRRIYNNINEKKAIYIAEKINYSSEINMTYVHPVGTNVINLDVINYYNNTYYYIKENQWGLDLNYWYYANSTSYSSMNITILIDSFESSFIDFFVNDVNPIYDPIITDGVIIAVYENNTWSLYNEPQWYYEGFCYSTELKNAYLIEMILSFDYVGDVEAGDIIYLHQIIILNEDYELVMVIIEEPMYACY